MNVRWMRRMTPLDEARKLLLSEGYSFENIERAIYWIFNSSELKARDTQSLKPYAYAILKEVLNSKVYSGKPPESKGTTLGGGLS